uniref:SFRICE_030528 n=1 Tax=Spodoptera frugiperda TaxID=7108 RepID=A0A2H1WQG8_SPOFR
MTNHTYIHNLTPVSYGVDRDNETPIATNLTHLFRFVNSHQSTYMLFDKYQGLIPNSLDLRRLGLGGWIKGLMQKAVLLETARIFKSNNGMLEAKKRKVIVKNEMTVALQI